MSEPVRVGVIGATGYSGRELVRLLSRHDNVKVTYESRSTQATSQPLGARIDHETHGVNVSEITIFPYDAQACEAACEVVFVALPSGVSGEIAAALWERGLRVIDLSGDLRLPADVYTTWYNKPPVPESVQRAAVYGLPEQNRTMIQEASLVANPGCYATCICLALLPAVGKGLQVDDFPIVIDAKSGVSGAGRSPSQHTHFPEMAGNFYPYRVGRHQHTPEIAQSLSLREDTLLLTTQLLPVNRGIYATTYVRLQNAEQSMREIYEHYQDFYHDEPFVRVLPPGEVPELSHVIGTNLCDIGLHLYREQGVLQVFSCIDNLMKGAAAQAIQNLNLMYGWPETTGLEYDFPFYP